MKKPSVSPLKGGGKIQLGATEEEHKPRLLFLKWEFANTNNLHWK